MCKTNAVKKNSEKISEDEHYDSSDTEFYKTLIQTDNDDFKDLLK